MATGVQTNKGYSKHSAGQNLLTDRLTPKDRSGHNAPQVTWSSGQRVSL